MTEETNVNNCASKNKNIFIILYHRPVETHAVLYLYG